MRLLPIPAWQTPYGRIWLISISTSEYLFSDILTAYVPWYLNGKHRSLKSGKKKKTKGWLSAVSGIVASLPIINIQR